MARFHQGSYRLFLQSHLQHRIIYTILQTALLVGGGYCCTTRITPTSPITPGLPRCVRHKHTLRAAIPLLRSLLPKDDVPRVRLIVEVDEVSAAQLYSLLNTALEERAWYSSRYLLRRVEPRDLDISQQAMLLCSAHKSNEPAMLSLLDVHQDALMYEWPMRARVPVQVVGTMQTEMASILKEKWVDALTCKCNVDEVHYPERHYTATMQILTAVDHADKDSMLEHYWQGRILGKSYDSIIRLALLQNDFMLLDYVARHHPETLLATFYGRSQKDLTKVALKDAAQRNCGAALVAVKEIFDLEERDDNGLTVLHYAARSGCISTVEKLLHAGVNPMQFSRGHITPLGHLLETFEQDEPPSPRCAALLTGGNVEYPDLVDRWSAEDPDGALWRVMYDSEYMQREFGEATPRLQALPRSSTVLGS